MASNDTFDILEIRDYFPSINNPSSSTWVFNQVKSLIENGYNPLVISPTPINPFKNIFKDKFRLYDRPSKKTEDYQGIKVIRPPYLKIPNNKLVGLTLNNLSNCINKYGDLKSIKLIHAHFGQNGLASLSLKRKLNVPLITSFYGYDSGRLAYVFKPYYRNLIKEGDLFLALSKDMKKDLLKLGFPEEKIIIHHLGIDFNEFKRINVEREKFQILTVARMDAVKGIQFVIEAISIFVNKYPEERNKIEYKIIGGGVFESELKKMVNTLDLSDIIKFFNNLIIPNSRQIVIKEMQNCDIFCLCSYVSENGSKEGTPIVLMEAQACGKPCISTFHAGIPEVVINGFTGILVKEKSAEEIVQAIEILYFNNKKRDAYGVNAENFIQKEFNNNEQMVRLLKIFKSYIV